MASWIHQLIAGAQEEKRLRNLRNAITATAREGRLNPDANVAERLTDLRRQHYDLTDCGRPH